MKRSIRIRRLRDIPLFPIIPFAPLVLVGGTFLFSLLSLRRISRVLGMARQLAARPA
jgi:hypothetical protein